MRLDFCRARSQRDLGIGGRDCVDEIEPSLDAVKSAIDIVEPLLNAGIIHFEAGDLSFEGAEPRYDFVQLAIHGETVIEPRKAGSQEIENAVGFADA